MDISVWDDGEVSFLNTFKTLPTYVSYVKKAECDLREKKISELNNKINLLNNKKKQEALNKIDKINTRKKELNNLQIKEDIKNELKNKTKKIKKTLDTNKKIEKKCKGNMIDCLLKDEKIHTDYKNSFKLVKDASFDEKIFKKKQNIPCIPRNDCSVCPKLSKGTPKSVRLNNNDKVEVFEKYEKKSNTDNLPTCPYSSCDSCDDSNYRLFDNAFNDKLMEKYGRDKK